MHFRVFTIIISLLLLNLTLSAQVIRFKIEIPTGFEVTDMGINPSVIDPMDNNNILTNARDQIRWVEIRSLENIPLIISIKQEKPSSSQPNLYFLNDGTSNLGEAKKKSYGTFVELMRNQNLSIENLADKPTFLSAWLGISLKSGTLITITYP